MHYHLLTRYSGRQKWETSFSRTVLPEIDRYLAELGMVELEYITIPLEEVQTMSNTLERNLDQFFRNEYVEKDHRELRPKFLRDVEFKGAQYLLHTTSPERSSLRLYHILQPVIAHRGEVIIYGTKYLDIRLMQILNIINQEKLFSTPALIERVEAIKHPNFVVKEALLDLEQKGFVRFTEATVSLTDKGRIEAN